MVRLQTENGVLEIRGSMVELYYTLVACDDLRLVRCVALNGESVYVNWENVLFAVEVEE